MGYRPADVSHSQVAKGTTTQYKRFLLKKCVVSQYGKLSPIRRHVYAPNAIDTRINMAGDAFVQNANLPSALGFTPSFLHVHVAIGTPER